MCHPVMSKLSRFDLSLLSNLVKFDEIGPESEFHIRYICLMNHSCMPGVCELLVVGDSAEEVLELVVGHVALPDERARELDDGPHDHQEPAM